MSEAPYRPDPDALRYQEHWQPVLERAAQRLLDRVAVVAGRLLEPGGPQGSPSRRPQVLDVGAGTGALALRLSERWPRARIAALDASSAMLNLAQQRAMSVAGSDDPERFSWLVADGAAMPLEPGSVDVAVSSFVLQLVDDRRAVLREIHRVLRPGGTLGFVTWRAEELHMVADFEFDEAVYELELDDPESVFREARPGDYESLEEARAELADAGFEGVDVRADQLSFSWTRDSYLRFKELFDERELFESLSQPDRDRLAQLVLRRWALLPEEAFRLEAPLVSAIARHS